MNSKILKIETKANVSIIDLTKVIGITRSKDAPPKIQYWMGPSEADYFVEYPAKEDFEERYEQVVDLWQKAIGIANANEATTTTTTMLVDN